MARDIEEDDDTPEPKKMAKGMPMPLIIAIVAGVLVLGCGGVSVAGFFAFWATAKKPTPPSDQVQSPEQDKQNAKQNEKSFGAPIADASPPLQMDSERAIVGAYRENSLAADAKAKGKKVMFTMTVQEVGRFEGKAMIAKCTTADSYYVMDGIRGVQSIKSLPTPPNFYAFAADDNDPILRTVKKGDTVIVTGYLKGRIDDGVVRGMGTKDEAFRVEVERCTYSIKTIPVPEVKIPAFSETNVGDTASWILSRFQEFKKLPKDSEEANASADRLIKDLDSLVNRKVRWEFTATTLKASSGKVTLGMIRAMKQAPSAHTVIFMASDATDAEKKGFESGIDLPPDYLKSVGLADTVVIEGTIDRVLQKLKTPHANQERYCPICFVLSNIKVTVKK